MKVYKKLLQFLLISIITVSNVNTSSVFATTKVSDLSTNEGVENLSGVSTEEMQDDFENQEASEIQIIENDSEISTYGIEEENYIYLSDIDYEENSKVDFGSIQKDTNVEGGAITLKVDGEVTTFKKGMAAQASSTLVYKVSDFIAQGYTRLSTYVGVDYSQKEKNNGVTFYILGSTDGKRWLRITKCGTLTSSDDAHYFDVDISTYDYVMLYAVSKGTKDYDHAVYGDLRLLKTDYDITSESYQGVLTVEAYDAILSKNSVDENFQNYKALVLKREFVNRIGYDTIQEIYEKDSAGL